MVLLQDGETGLLLDVKAMQRIRARWGGAESVGGVGTGGRRGWTPSGDLGDGRDRSLEENWPVGRTV
jgi:hypothetical protein